MQRSTKQTPCWALSLVLTALVAASFWAVPAMAADAPLPVITIDGEANADVTPDTARLSLGVETERPTAAAATADLAKAAQAMMETLRTEGIDRKDITTTALALSPLYPEDQGRAPAAPARPRAFRAATTVAIVVRPAERAGTIASRLIDSGANTIEGIDYSSSEAEARLDGLRADAMRDARRKAEIYVGALGLHLGHVVEITPDSSTGPRPQPMMRTMAVAKAMVPTAPGSLTLHAGVSVRWTIEP